MINYWLVYTAYVIGIWKKYTSILFYYTILQDLSEYGAKRPEDRPRPQRRTRKKIFPDAMRRRRAGLRPFRASGPLGPQAGEEEELRLVFKISISLRARLEISKLEVFSKICATNLNAYSDQSPRTYPGFWQNFFPIEIIGLKRPS